MRTQEPPAYRELERARAWAQCLERFRLAEAILDRDGYMAQDMVLAFRESQFSSPMHRSVFSAICGLVNRGARELDFGMVIGELQRMGVFEQFENCASYVVALTDGAIVPPSPASRLFRLAELASAWGELARAREEVQRAE